MPRSASYGPLFCTYVHCTAVNTAAATTPAIAIHSDASWTRGLRRTSERSNTITSAAANMAMSGAIANQSIDGAGIGFTGASAPITCPAPSDRRRWSHRG